MRTHDLSFAQRLQSARQGDSAAFYQLCSPYLKRYTLRAESVVRGNLQSRGDAEEILQNTWMSAWRSFPGFQGNSQGEWATWLDAIITAELNMFLRKELSAKRTPNREDAGTGTFAPRLEEQAIADQTSPSEGAIRNEAKKQIDEALDAQSHEDQELIKKAKIEELSVSEIANRFNRSQSAVRGSIYRAMKRFQSYLEQKFGKNIKEKERNEFRPN